jgi:hypothetical protein
LRGCLIALLFAILAFRALAFLGSGASWLRMHAQAIDVLARYAAAVETAGGPPAFAVVGQQIRQLGDWEPTVADDGKRALLAGAVETGVPLQFAAPPPATVRWPDGSTETVQLVDAQSAFDALRSPRAAECGCRPLKVAGARLSSQQTVTTRGTAEIPVWEFTIEGSVVRITVIAVSRPMVNVPQVDPGFFLIGIDKARLSVDGRMLVAEFAAGAGPGQSGCLHTYNAEAVESDLAVVVLLHEDTSLWCRLLPGTAGAWHRTADVALATPLNGRAVLEARFGQPVKVVFSDSAKVPVDAQEAVAIARSEALRVPAGGTATITEMGAATPGNTTDGRPAWVIDITVEMRPSPADPVLITRAAYYVDIETADVRTVQLDFQVRTPPPALPSVEPGRRD